MHGRDSRFHYRPDTNPGPGAYGLGTTVGNAPAFSLSGRIDRRGRDMDTPGPGSYVRPSTAPNRRDRSLGTDQRFRYKNNEVPGPGAYKQPNPNEGKGWSLGARTEYQGNGRADAPGPGAYIRPMSAPSGTRKSAAFGKDRRFHNQHSSDAPGPGAYRPSSGLVYTDPTKGISLKGRPKDPRPEGGGEYLYPERTHAGDHAFVGRREFGHGYVGGGGYSAM